MSVVLRGASGNLAEIDGTGALKISGSFSATTVEESVGALGAAIPVKATSIAGPDDGGLLRSATVLNTTPTGTEYALLVRNVGSAALGSEGVVGAAMPATSIAIGALREGTGNLGTLQVDADNNLHVTARTTLPDAANSRTAAALGANTNWLGSWVDAEEFPYVSVSMKADQPSATDGWKLQFSADGVNVGCEFASTYDATMVGNGRSFVIQRRGRYYRLSYTNGATPATAVALLSLLQKVGSVGEAILADSPVLSHYVSLLTKSVISGKTTGGGGAYVDVKVNPSGSLAIDGTVAATQSGAWTISSITNPVAVTGTFWQATQPVSIAGTIAVSGPLTDTQLRATPVPVSLGSTTITGSVAVTGTFWQATQPVSIAASVAVTGPLTDTQLRATPVPTSISGSVAVTGTFWQATQPVSAVSLPLPTGAATETTLGNVLTTSAFQTRINTLGQKAMAASTPVVLASDQSSIPVTLASTTIAGSVAVTGTFWQATQPVSIAASVTVAQATAANLRTQTSAESATGVAPSANAVQVGGTDGTNLRAIKTDANGRVVTVEQSGTAAISRVATSVASAQLLPANTGRVGVIIVNDSTGVLFVKYGTTASATSYTYRIASNGTLELGFGYTGRIDAILNTGTGNAQVTELTN